MRRTAAIVARREFLERVRERSFLVSTAVTVVILVGIVVASRVLGRGASFDVGAVGAEASAAAGIARTAAGTQGVEVRVLALADPAEAERALRDGRVDVVLVGDERILVRSGAPTLLLQLLQASVLSLRVRASLMEEGRSVEEVLEIVSPLPVRALEPVRPGRDEQRSVALVAVLVLYGQMFGYGVWVATGIVEEKSSRVVELLLSAVRPRQLLLGKVVGLGLLGLFQLLVIGSVGVTAAVVAEVVRVPADALGSLGLVLIWFVLGFAFYSGLFACAGATVSRQEELQNALLPLQLVVLGSLVVAISSLEDPTSTLARVTSFIPPTAPLAMPPRLIGGDAGPLAALASAAISLAATAALVPAAARIYAGAILRVGARVRWREAWRAERGTA